MCKVVYFNMFQFDKTIGARLKIHIDDQYYRVSSNRTGKKIGK